MIEYLDLNLGILSNFFIKLVETCHYEKILAKNTKYKRLGIFVIMSVTLGYYKKAEK
jgi:hypothetical protein